LTPLRVDLGQVLRRRIEITAVTKTLETMTHTHVCTILNSHAFLSGAYYTD